MFSAAPLTLKRVLLPGCLILAFGLVLATPSRGDAQEQNRCIIKGKLPGRGYLQPLVPNVQIYSFNGKVFQRPTPRPTPTYRPRRTRDPMVVRGDKLHPGSTLEVQRQRHSKSLEGKIKGRMTCKQVTSLAESALVWSDKVVVKPEVQSRAQPFAEIVKEPAKVFWPNSPVRVTGTDRDGRQLKEQRLQVQGMNATNEQIFNHATQQMQNIRQSGDALPSSRAWAIKGNLLVSQPVRDVASMGRGKQYMKKARRLRNTHAALQNWAETTQAALSAGKYDKDPAK